VPAPSHRCVYVSATRPEMQAIKHRLEKNRDVDTPHPILSLRIQFASAEV